MGGDNNITIKIQGQPKTARFSFRKTITIIKYTFTIIGVGALIGCLVLSVNTIQFIKQGIITTGIVVELVRSNGIQGSTLYKPVVEFTTPDGLFRFESSVEANPPSHRVGEQVAVIYDPASPDNASIKSFTGLWFSVTIIGILGFIFFSIGFGMILYGRVKGNTIKRLRKFGLPIETRFQRVELNGSVSVNNKHPYRIVSEYVKDGELYVFHSENIWSDISNEIITDNIKVLVDPNNMKKYYMDISFLPVRKS